MIESGVAGMEITPSWYGLFAPAKTPAAIVGKLHREIESALGNRGVRERLAALNVKPDGNPPAELKVVRRGFRQALCRTGASDEWWVMGDG